MVHWSNRTFRVREVHEKWRMANLWCFINMLNAIKLDYMFTRPVENAPVFLILKSFLYLQWPREFFLLRMQNFTNSSFTESWFIMYACIVFQLESCKMMIEYRSCFKKFGPNIQMTNNNFRLERRWIHYWKHKRLFSTIILLWSEMFNIKIVF